MKKSCLCLLLPLCLAIPTFAKAQQQYQDNKKHSAVKDSYQETRISKINYQETQIFEQATEYNGKIYKVKVKEDYGQFSLLDIAPYAPDSIQSKIFTIASADRRMDLIRLGAHKKYVSKFSNLALEITYQLVSEGFKDYFEKKYGSIKKEAEAKEPSWGDVAQSFSELEKTLEMYKKPNGYSSEDWAQRSMVHSEQLREQQEKEANAKRSKERITDLETRVKQEMASMILETLEKGYEEGDDKYYHVFCESPTIAVHPLMQVAICVYSDFMSVKNFCNEDYFIYRYSRPLTADTIKSWIDGYSKDLAEWSYELDYIESAAKSLCGTSLSNVDDGKSFKDMFKKYDKNVDLDGRLVIGPKDEEDFKILINRVWRWIRGTNENIRYKKAISDSVLDDPNNELMHEIKNEYFRDVLKDIE